MTKILYTFLTVTLFLYSCSVNNSTSHLVEVDITSSYKEKDIDLNEFLTFSFIPLETNEEAIISAYPSYFIGDSLIIVKSENDIVLFNKEGKYINRFNRLGKADNEYNQINNIVVDFQAKEIFIQGYKPDFLVYSLEGDFKRRLNVSEKYKAISTEYQPVFLRNQVLNYDDDYLIAVDDRYLDFPNAEDKINYQPYMLISKIDGTITPLSLKMNNRYGNRFLRTITINGKEYTQPIELQCSKLQKFGGDILVSEFTLDTIYVIKKGVFKPTVVVKGKGNREYLTEVIYNSKPHIIVRVAEKSFEEKEGNFSVGKNMLFFCDKITSSVNVIGDFIGCTSYIYSKGGVDLTNEYTSFNALDASELIELYEDGMLQGELLNIASKLRFADNPILILGKIK